MEKQQSDLKPLLAVLDNLEHKYPGSVVIDETTGAITLIGWRLEQFNYAQDDKSAADNIKGDSRGLYRSRVSGDLTAGATKGTRNQHLSVRMVNPLTDTPKGAAKGNKPRRCRRVCSQDSGSVNQKNKESTSNEHFIPVVKRQFRYRVFHVLSRLMFWMR
jgi:hypothetical protein